MPLAESGGESCAGPSSGVGDEADSETPLPPIDTAIHSNTMASMDMLAVTARDPRCVSVSAKTPK